MWGGAATVSPHALIRANTFVFNQGIGHDTIMDFRSGVDHIDLEGFGLSSFQQLEPLFHTTANGLDIVFNTSSDILLHGVSHVAAGDFVFS
jgi:Ca2+-binding RTX toxin-like protein